MRKVIATECAPGAIGPYVQGVDLGSMVLTSGQIPVCPQTGEVAENVADQARQSDRRVCRFESERYREDDRFRF